MMLPVLTATFNFVVDSDYHFDSKLTLVWHGFSPIVAFISLKNVLLP